MPNLYALLVAIDEYPIERHRLNGCNNDLQDFKNFLEESIGSDQFGQTQIKTLTNAEASRQNVINEFSLFDSAQADDVCVFYFCGHGSQSPAPKEFWHLAPDHMNESILCWDSRSEGGRDLMDKELSYLIWKATNGKELQFVVLMDCCHSGSNTRDPGITARMAEAGDTLVAVEDYLGYGQYKITDTAEGVEASPPRGKHIHLAAAKNSETAKELKIDGNSRGIFTYSLLNVLRQSGQAMSYGELINRTAIRIRSKVSQQSPQAEASESGDLMQAFLGGIKNKKYNLLVSHDATQGWIVNGGAVQGLKVSDSNNGLFLQLEDHPNRKVLVTNVSPNQSTLSGMEGLATDQVYNAQLIHEFENKLTIALDDDERMEQMRLLLDKDKTFITVVDEQEAPRYLLSANDRGFQLSSAGKGGFSFAAVSGYKQEAAAYFISKLEKIARWNQLLSLSNPTTRISSKDLKVELFKNMAPGNLEDDTVVKPLNWIFPEPFEYIDKDGWQQPAFQLKITNTGSRTLWVSALYMGFDFSITNHLLAKQELKAGESVWLADVYEGYPYRTIPLQVDDLLFEVGLRKVTDYIKIIASTDEIDTELYNQERLYEESEILEATRGLGRRSRPQAPDWVTREIELKIIREEEEDEVEMAAPPDMEAPATRGPGDKVIAPSTSDKTFSDVSAKEELEELPTVLSTPLSTDNTGDEVDCSVYAAPESSTGDDLFIQVWLHLPELKDAATEKAKEFDDEAEQRAYQSLSLPLEKGDDITLVLTAKGVELDEATQKLFWNGSLQSAQFIASIPEDYAKNKAIFTVRVFKEDIPIGHLKFIIKISEQPPTRTEKEALGTEAKRYKKAFISYASKDRNEVLKRVQMLNKLGIDFFQDLINLNPGERWEQKLYENIDDSDLFLLFWSTAAKESKWVLKELQYAIRLKKHEDDNPPVIQPVPIEGPPIVTPPEELGHMHFNDQILYFIVE